MEYVKIPTTFFMNDRFTFGVLTFRCNIMSSSTKEFCSTSGPFLRHTRAGGGWVTDTSSGSPGAHGSFCSGGLWGVGRSVTG